MVTLYTAHHNVLQGPRGHGVAPSSWRSDIGFKFVDDSERSFDRIDTFKIVVFLYIVYSACIWITFSMFTFFFSPFLNRCGQVM